MNNSSLQRAALAYLLFLLVIPAAAGVSIIEFCPDTNLPGDPDEYIILSGEGPLGGITVSDGEGTIGFPQGTWINGTLVLARNATAYRMVHGNFPDFEWEPAEPGVPDAVRTGRFQLANREDEIILLSGGNVIERVSWPGQVTRREGQVHYRGETGWDPRVLMLGQSRITAPVLDTVDVTLFLSPDCGRPTLLSFIREATHELLVNVYECTDPEIAGAMADAARRGVKVTVLLEGGPVGGISDEEKTVVSLLTSAGADVRMMSGSGASKAPYRFDHAKYIVSDGSAALVTSENFKSSGFPACGAPGNRGWGVVLRSQSAAAFFRDLFLADATGPGVMRWDGAQQGGGMVSRPDDTPPGTPGSGRGCPSCTRDLKGIRVIPVVSPDGSDAVTAMIREAGESLEIEQAYIRMNADGEPIPFLAEVVNASRRGVSVRVLLDASWFNTEGENDNDEIAAWINSLAVKEGLPMEARCSDLASAGILKIHTKGVITDKKRALVSSINWNTNSPTFNRELGVILDDPAAAGYFLTAFEEDWASAKRVTWYALSGGSPSTQFWKFYLAIGVVLAIAGYYYIRRKRGG